MDKSVLIDEKTNNICLSVTVKGPTGRLNLTERRLEQLSNHLEKTVLGWSGMGGGCIVWQLDGQSLRKCNDQINGLIMLMGTLSIVMQEPGTQNKCAAVCWWNASKAVAVLFQSMHYTSLRIKRKPTALWCFLFYFFFFAAMIILY